MQLKESKTRGGHSTSSSPDQITIYSSPDETIKTYKGPMSWEDWLHDELLRFTSSGHRVYIKKNKKGRMALCRK